MENSLQGVLEEKLLRNLARLSLSGTIIYPVLFITLYFTTTLAFEPFGYIGFALVLPASLLRLHTARKVLGHGAPPESRARTVLRLTVIASAAGWSIFSATSIYRQGASDWNTMLLLLISTGLASGGALALASDRPLTTIFLVCLWGSHAGVLFDLGDRVTALVVTLFCLYLSLQAREQHRILLNSILDREQIKARTLEAQQAGDEARQLQATAEDARRDAEGASRAKSRFLATIGHEIRTPLHGVLGMNTLLLDTELSPEQREYAETIRASGKALLAIINDVLDFSKLEAGKEESRPEDFAPTDILKQAVGIVNQKAQSKGIALVLELSDTIPKRIRCDASHLRQIMLNLLSNAIKFTDHGRIVMQASVDSSDPERDRLCISVSDTGIGISEKDMALLFEPFRQVNSATTRSRGGSGLGLAISKRLAQYMGGTLTGRSELGKGTEFLLEVPFEPPLSPSRPSEELDPPRLRRVDKDGVRILVAEDNLTNQKIMTRLLSKAGYHCDVVENGLAALEAAGRASYDLIFMDCHMPQMDGYDATRRLVEQLGEKTPPIVAVTANATTEDQKLCRDAGMVGFLSKPVRLGPLQDVLDSHLGLVE